AIGVARLGSSRDPTPSGFFYGPEPGMAPPAAYRDPAGDLKRQAARFPIFRCARDANGRLIDAAEITLDDAAALIVDTAFRSVTMPGERAVFDTGRFRSTPVALGAIVMEPAGRLRVLGGYGRSGSDPPQPALRRWTGRRIREDSGSRSHSERSGYGFPGTVV